MEKDPLKPDLFEKFIANKSNAAELEAFFKQLASTEETQLQTQIELAFNQADEQLSKTDELRLQKIQQGLNQQIFAKPTPKLLRLIKSGAFLRVAAILLVMVSLGIGIAKLMFTANPVLPGSTQAMVHLATVDTLLTTKKAGVLYRSKGVVVTTQPDGTMVFMVNSADSVAAAALNTITTPKGGEYRVILSDGSKVMLNAASKLTFPTGFRGAERRVQVDGEAYFEVAKNAQKPFIVTVGDNEIKVLGTHFNVSNFPEDGGTQATLLEGSIRFANKNGEKVILKPNQQVTATYGKLNLKNVTAEDFKAWTKGEFLFNDVPLTAVMQKLARWYNIEVDSKSIPDKNIYLKIARSTSFDEMLVMISKATDYQFELKGNTLVLKE